MRTFVPSVASSAMRLTNSKNCVARTIEYGIDEFLDQLLLRDLGPEVAALRHSVAAHDRQGHVMAHARRGFGGKEIDGRSLEELQHRRVFERGRVRHVDDDGGAGEDLGQPLAR